MKKPIIKLPLRASLLPWAVLFIAIRRNKRSRRRKSASGWNALFLSDEKWKWKRMVPHEAIKLKHFCKVSLALSSPSLLLSLSSRLHPTESSPGSRGGWIFESVHTIPKHTFLCSKSSALKAKKQNTFFTHSWKDTHTNFLRRPFHSLASQSHENVEHYQRKEFSSRAKPSVSFRQAFSYASRAVSSGRMRSISNWGKKKNNFTLFSEKPKCFPIFRLRRYQWHCRTNTHEGSSSSEGETTGKSQRGVVENSLVPLCWCAVRFFFVT